MEEILDNLRVLSPFAIVSWLLFLISVWRRPQRFRNSLLLMTALGFTAFMLTGLFGEYMQIAFFALCLLVFAMLLLVPIMLVFNGFQMIRKEGRSLPHMLSLLLGLIIGVGEFATLYYLLGDHDIAVWLHLYKWMLLISMSVFYFSVLILAFVLYVVFIQIMPHRKNFNYIIIHGSGLLDGDRVPKLLANRIDRAIELFHACGDRPMLIPSGGQGGDETISEAEAMTRYLREHGVPEDHILMEDRSGTTLENLINSKSIIERREGDKKTALVSSNYHVYRCLIYASGLKMRCVGIGAKVAWYYWPSAVIREFVAVFTRKRHLILILLGYVVFALMPGLFLFMR